MQSSGEQFHFEAVPQLPSAKTHRSTVRGRRQLGERSPSWEKRRSQERRPGWAERVTAAGTQPRMQRLIFAPGPLCVRLVASHADSHHHLCLSLPPKAPSDRLVVKHSSFTSIRGLCHCSLTFYADDHPFFWVRRFFPLALRPALS